MFEFLMKITETLKILRAKHNVTQAAIASDLEIATSTYHFYETVDDGKIQLKMLRKIADYYKMTVGELLSYNDSSNLPANEVVKKYEHFFESLTANIQETEANLKVRKRNETSLEEMLKFYKDKSEWLEQQVAKINNPEWQGKKTKKQRT